MPFLSNSLDAPRCLFLQVVFMTVTHVHMTDWTLHGPGYDEGMSKFTDKTGVRDRNDPAGHPSSFGANDARYQNSRSSGGQRIHGLTIQRMVQSRKASKKMRLGLPGMNMPFPPPPNRHFEIGCVSAKRSGKTMTRTFFVKGVMPLRLLQGVSLH